MRIVLPTPHPGQLAVRQQAKRFNFLAAGRRWRKTTLVMTLAIEAVLRGETVLWTAPTYDQVRVGWQEAYKAAANTFRFNQGSMTVESSATNGKILFRSLDDPDNARGHTANGILIDESADVKELAYYEVLRPMLMDNNGWLWAIGTPKRRNWFWREHVRAQKRANATSWQIPTVGCEITNAGLVRRPHPYENPYVPFEELVDQFDTMPEYTFRQEILAEFLEDTGNVFRGVSQCTGVSFAPYDPTHTYVMGVDWGKTNDFTVLTVIDANTNDVVDWDRFNQVDWAVQRGRLGAMAQRWGVTTILAEKNSIGDPNIEALQKEGYPVRGFTTTWATKAEIVEYLALLIETRRIRYPALPVLMEELQSYEMERTVTGIVQYHAPEGMHDDAVMSLALAAWAGKNDGARIPFAVSGARIVDAWPQNQGATDDMPVANTAHTPEYIARRRSNMGRILVGLHDQGLALPGETPSMPPWMNRRIA